MVTNIRSQLFFLKQFGFSEKFLNHIYDLKVNPVNCVFNLEKELFIINNSFLTPHDVILASKKDEFNRFVKKLLEEDDFLKNKSNHKIFFKHDTNELTKILPKDIMPMFMYAKGDISLLNERKKRIAIIGTRKPTKRSIEIANQLSISFLNQDYIIVSGLAEGIDTISHQVALDNNGKTIAVLPTNFNKIYPVKNKSLAQEISKSGLLLTAVGPKENTYKSTFLERNKYVANISDIILVIETNLKSGTMNTIRNASEANKKILFVDQGDKSINKKIFDLGGEMIDENIE